jgi:hypothetical protein
MATVAAIAASVILLALAVLQVAVAAGAPLGRFVWGGQHQLLPRRLRIASVVSVFLYAVFVLVLLDRASIITVLPDVVAFVAAWVLFGYFVLGIGLNAISRSRAERFTMAPVCLILAVLTIVVALS